MRNELVKRIGFLLAAEVSITLVACGGSPRFVPPERTVYFPLPATADENSPLTYVVKSNSGVDHSAPFVTGKTVTQKGHGDISEVVSASDELRISGGLDQVRIAAGSEDVTHIIVDAHVESVDVVRDIKYNKKSKCCEEGMPTDSCIGGYIESVLVGTGTVTYAKMKDGTDSGTSAQPKEAKANEPVSKTQLEPIRTLSFQSSYFAFTAASADRACEFSE